MQKLDKLEDWCCRNDLCLHGLQETNETWEQSEIIKTGFMKEKLRAK